jgi:signal transduction histidine kinase
MFDEHGRVSAYQSFGNDITERKHAEDDVQLYQERLKALASQLTIAEERERRRIAADLHDHVGQSLAFARIQLAAARKSTSLEKRNAILDDTSETLLHTIQDTKNLIFELSAPSMNEIGLGAAISEWLEEQIGRRYGLKTEFIDEIDESLRKTLDDNVRAILFRNVRELLTNVVKHAHANQVCVSMGQADAFLKIVVQDDGVGFDYSSEFQGVKSESGFGLFSIQERMSDLSGSLEIVSEPGKGCKAILKVPMDEGRTGVSE